MLDWCTLTTDEWCGMDTDDWCSLLANEAPPQVLPPVDDDTSTGDTTDVETDELIDDTATFIDDGVEVGDEVTNTDTGETTTVVSVDSQTTLTLADDIFTESGQGYIVGPVNNEGIVTVETQDIPIHDRLRKRIVDPTAFEARLNTRFKGFRYNSGDTSD